MPAAANPRVLAAADALPAADDDEASSSVAESSTAANAESVSASSSAVAASPAATSVASVPSRRSRRETLEAYKDIENKNTELVNLPSLPGSLFLGLGRLKLRNLCSYIVVNNTQARASSTSISRVLVPFTREKRLSPEVHSHT